MTEQREPGWYWVTDVNDVEEPAQYVEPDRTGSGARWWYRCGWYMNDETLGCEIGLRIPTPDELARKDDASRVAEREACGQWHEEQYMALRDENCANAAAGRPIDITGTMMRVHRESAAAFRARVAPKPEEK